MIAGTVKLADYRPPDFRIDTVELSFDLDAERTIVRNRMTVRRSPEATLGAPLVLDGEKLELLSLSLNEEVLRGNRIEQRAEGLAIADVPDSFSLEIVTAIHPAKNKTRQGLFELGGKLATQCEAQGFRAMTYFPDRPDVLSSYKVTLRADRAKYPVLLSNGNLVESGLDPDGRHWTTWVDPWRKPSYIFGVSRAILASLKTNTSRQVDVT